MRGFFDISYINSMGVCVCVCACVLYSDDAVDFMLLFNRLALVNLYLNMMTKTILPD